MLKCIEQENIEMLSCAPEVACLGDFGGSSCSQMLMNITDTGEGFNACVLNSLDCECKREMPFCFVESGKWKIESCIRFSVALCVVYKNDNFSRRTSPLLRGGLGRGLARKGNFNHLSDEGVCSFSQRVHLLTRISKFRANALNLKIYPLPQGARGAKTRRCA